MLASTKVVSPPTLQPVEQATEGGSWGSDADADRVQSELRTTSADIIGSGSLNANQHPGPR